MASSTRELDLARLGVLNALRRARERPTRDAVMALRLATRVLNRALGRAIATVRAEYHPTDGA